MSKDKLLGNKISLAEYILHEVRKKTRFIPLEEVADDSGSVQGCL